MMLGLTVTGEELYDLTIKAGGAATALAAVWKWVYKPIRKCVKSHFDRVNIAFETVERISKQVHRNGGASMADDVSRLINSVENVRQDLQKNVALQRAAFHDDEKCIIQTDHEGRAVWVNRTACRIFECSASDLMGFNWKNTVCEEFRDNFFNEWEHAMADKRDMVTRVCMRTSYDRKFNGDVRATAIIDNERGTLFGHLVIILQPLGFSAPHFCAVDETPTAKGKNA